MTKEEYEARFRAIRDEYLEAIWDYEDNGEFGYAKFYRREMEDELRKLKREYMGQR